MLHSLPWDIESLAGMRPFEDRRQAGRLLAKALSGHVGDDPLVFGLPRGGVPVADEVARARDGALGVWVSRKLGVRSQPELGMGAVAEGPVVVIDQDTMNLAGVTRARARNLARREMAEVQRCVERFRAGRTPPDLRGRVVILVDDGIATGGTMRAAVRGVKKRHPARLIVAVPVASRDVVDELRRDVDEVVCLHQPAVVYAIGIWYEDFRPVREDEAIRILERSRPAPLVGTSSLGPARL